MDKIPSHVWPEKIGEFNFFENLIAHKWKLQSVSVRDLWID